MKTEGYEPAQPATVAFNEQGQYHPQTGSEQWMMPGLTKREHFASTLQNNFESLPLHVQETICGERAPSYVTEDLEGFKEVHQSFGDPYVEWLLKGKAKYAVLQADALILALNKEG